MQNRKTTVFLTASLATCLAAAVPATAQDTPFKSEVDGLILALRQGAAKDGDDKGAMGDRSCTHTAMVLASMARSHRGYHAGDGPVIRVPVRYLFQCRQADGSFKSEKDKDALTATLWVHAALSALDPERYEQEIQGAARWCNKNHIAAKGHDPFFSKGAERDKVMAEAGAAAKAAMMAMRTGKAEPDQLVQALYKMVKAQVAVGGAKGQDKKAAPKKPTWSKVQQRGFDGLSKHQKGGVFSVPFPQKGKDGTVKILQIPDPGLTAMGLAALMTKPKALRSDDEQKVIDAGLGWLVKQQNTDKGPVQGSFGSRQRNYTTCAAVMALAKTGDPTYDGALKMAQRYVLAIQNVEKRDYAPGDRDYGSIGYGGDMRGDLSNLQFALQALKQTKLRGDHEAFAKAIVFLQRTQNLRSTNDLKKMKVRVGEKKELRNVSPDNDGGAAYYPGNSPAGYKELSDGTLLPRSYGSMTYALLKAYTMCGLDKNDKRVQAAVAWIGKNWNLDINPGSDPKMPEKAKYQGLYYYYMVMAQALDIAGIDHLEVIGDAEKKTKIDWRARLKAKLAAMQNDKGVWLNEKNGRWWESMDLVCTTYAMLALERCR